MNADEWEKLALPERVKYLDALQEAQRMMPCPVCGDSLKMDMSFVPRLIGYRGCCSKECARALVVAERFGP